MNNSFRSLWNERTGTFVAVSENASSQGKKTSGGTTASGAGTRFGLQALAWSLACVFAAHAQSLPLGGVVAAGSASISATANQTTINQTSQNAIINWQSFNIGAGQSVQFVQPNVHSVALNRVLGANPSGIFGSLNANGNVFLVNPNGILFGQGAAVNVAGLVASTLNITDSNFLAGNYQFAGTGAGSVVNQGSINADGGYVALLGASVSNEGVISAQLGSVALAGGNAMTLDLAGDGLLNIAVNEGAVNALVQNGGLIQADGGQVLLTTQAAGSLLQNAVNNTGVIRAQTLVTGKSGSIKLMGGMTTGTVNVGGTLDASAPNGGDGGFIETSAAQVVLAENKNITTLARNGKTGMWLLDPVNWQIGNDGVVVGDETPASVVTSLALTDRTISATNNITVAEAVTWVSPQILTLDAGNDVLIKAAMTASGINSGMVFNAVNNVIVDNSSVAPALRELTASASGAKIVMNAATGNVTVTTAVTASALNAKIDMSAGGNVTVGVVTASAGGAVNLRANNDVIVNGMITADTNNNAVILRADNDGSGPGALAGTVKFGLGGGISTPLAVVRFNPDGYVNTVAEITAYGLKNTGAMDSKAWVFGKGVNKMYDGTRIATVSGLKPDVGGVQPAVALGAVTSALFDTKHVGAQKPITYATIFNNATFDLFAPVGFTAGTYLARADITARLLTITAVTDSRVYNGTTSSVGVPTVAGLQVGDAPTDTLTGPLTQAYQSKNVMGTNSSTLVATGPYAVNDGNGGANYVITVNTALGSITPLALVGNITAANKVYDTNNTATIVTRTLNPGVLGADDVSYSGGTATFSDKNVADGKTVTGVGLGLSGADAGNYTVNPTDTTTANITPIALVGNITAANKVYDANNTATIVTRTLNPGVLGAEDVTYSGGTATFDTPAAGVGKPVTGTGLGLTGADKGNYTVNPTAVTTAAITAPVVVVPPVIVVPPDVVAPPDVTPPVSTPPESTPPAFDIPVVNLPPDRVPPIVVTPPVSTPPYLIPPVIVPPEVVTPPLAEVPPVVAPPPVVPPVVVSVETPPSSYVAPLRKRKQDRN